MYSVQCTAPKATSQPQQESAWGSFLVCHVLYSVKKIQFRKGRSETGVSMGHKSNAVGEDGEGEKSIPLKPLKVILIQYCRTPY